MKININRTTLLEGLEICLKFTAGRTTNNNLLRGILIKGKEGRLDLYATNLSFFIHTTINTETKTGEFRVVVDPNDLIEYLGCVESENVSIEITENSLIISQDKSRGSFSLINGEEFPLPPKIKEAGMIFDAESIKRNLPLLLFSASKDDSRPVLTSINLILEGDRLTMVSTDGFRLSVVQEKISGGLRPMLVSAEFLNNVLQTVKNKNPKVFYLSEEKVVAFQIDKTTLYARLVDGEFPPYEKVIPTDKKTTISVDKTTLLKGIRQMAIFAKNSGGIIIFNIKKDLLEISPKSLNKNSDYIWVEGAIEGDEQKVAFNHRFLTDLLNHLDGDRVKIEILRSDAPVLFRDESNKSFFHIIMPVRIGD